MNEIMQLLGGHFGWLAATVAWIGSVRLALKPFQLKIQNLLGSIVTYVVGSPEQDDDTLLSHILSSKTYRVIAFGADILASLKLPTSQSLIDAEKSKGSGPSGGAIVALALAGTIAALAASGSLSGCATPQRTAYQVTASTSVSVEVALHTYNVFAAQGRTTVAQNRQVKTAYERYQLAMLIVCDAGRVYAATDGASGSEALQQAVSNADASLADLINLIRSFGIKI